MAQWLSRTRKLNNHYQSGRRGGMRLPTWTGDPQAIDALYLGQGKYAYFYPIMYDEDAATEMNDSGEMVAYIPRTRETPVITAKMTAQGASAREMLDVYAGLYDHKTVGLLNEPIAVNFAEYGLENDPTYGNSFNLQLNDSKYTDPNAGNYRLMVAQNGGPGVVVIVDRWQFYYYACPTGSELPEVYQFMQDYPAKTALWKPGDRMTPGTETGRNNIYKLINSLLDEVTGGYKFRNIPGLCGATIGYRLQQYSNLGTALPPNGTKLLGGGDPAGTLEAYERGRLYGAIQISCSPTKTYSEDIGRDGDNFAIYQGPTFGGISDGVDRFGTVSPPDYAAHGAGYGPGRLKLYGNNICVVQGKDTERYSPMGYIKGVGAGGSYYPVYGVIRRVNSMRVQSNCTFFNNV